MKTSTYLKTSFGVAAFTLLGFTSQAQITITESDMPQVGAIYVTVNDTNSETLAVGVASGSAQTWNLSIGNNYIDTTFAENPSALPYYSDFASSNLAVRIDVPGEPEYIYGNLTSGSLAIAGQAAVQGSTVYLDNFAPSQINLPLPATYGTKWGGTYRSVLKYNSAAYPGFDSIEINSSTTYVDTVDGFGSLTIPSGTYPSLRVMQLNTPNYDSVLGYSTSLHSWQYITSSVGGSQSESLKWFGNGKGISLATLQLSAPNSNTVTDATYLKSTDAGIDEISDNSSSQVYPNPSSGLVNIILKPSNENGYVKIIDLAGREIENSSLKNGKTQLNTSAYANGIYLYLITDMNGNLLDKGKFTVSH